MAHLIENTFSSYSLTDEEELQGSVLTITQKQVIQNQLAMLAEEKLSLEFDVNNQMQYVQIEAGLQGEIKALRYMLDRAVAAEEAINNPPETNQ